MDCVGWGDTSGQAGGEQQAARDVPWEATNAAPTRSARGIAPPRSPREMGTFPDAAAPPPASAGRAGRIRRTGRHAPPARWSSGPPHPCYAWRRSPRGRVSWCCGPWPRAPGGPPRRGTLHQPPHLWRGLLARPARRLIGRLVLGRRRINPPCCLGRLLAGLHPRQCFPQARRRAIGELRCPIFFRVRTSLCRTTMACDTARRMPRSASATDVGESHKVVGLVARRSRERA